MVAINTICSVWLQWKATVGKKITLEESYGNGFKKDVHTFKARKWKSKRRISSLIYTALLHKLSDIY